jgi:hypothetical protein
MTRWGRPNYLYNPGKVAYRGTFFRHLQRSYSVTMKRLSEFVVDRPL